MSELGATIDALAHRFVARCSDDLPKLEQCLASAGQDRGDVLMIVHKMAGIAGLLGYSAIGNLASQVDEELSVVPPIEPKTLPALVDAIEALLKRAAASEED